MLRRSLVRAAATIGGKPSDASLVDLPGPVASCCSVHRNVISGAMEQRLWEELSPILKGEGQKTFIGPSADKDDSMVRNNCIDLFGFEQFLTMKDWSRMTERRVPGLIWSQTLMDIVNTMGKEVLGEVPDTVRVMEHNLPGYEMHVEAPPFGSSFLVLNVFAPSIIAFDNEAEARRGSCYLPNRGMAHVSGELRWGWRVGEHFHEQQYFSKLKRELTPEYRMTLWMFKTNLALADRRQLSEKVEATVGRMASQASGETTLGMDGNDTTGVVAPEVLKAKQSATPGMQEFETENAQRAREEAEAKRLEKMTKEKEEEEEFARQALEGSGLLGGDMPRKEAPKDDGADRNTYDTGHGFRQPKNQDFAQKEFQGYKKDLGRLTKLSEELQKRKANGTLSEEFMASELSKGFGGSSVDKDEFGFDRNDPDATWDSIGRRAAHYRDRVKSMNFDGSEVDKNATPQQRAQSMADSLTDLTVEPFDPKKAAEVLERNRAEMRKNQAQRQKEAEARKGKKVV